MTALATKFVPGKIYAARSVTDHTVEWIFKVQHRTAKFVTLTDPLGVERRRGVKVSEGEEFVLPLGDYSMAPVLRAVNVA